MLLLLQNSEKKVSSANKKSKIQKEGLDFVNQPSRSNTK